MKIKRFEAGSMSDALRMIKKEFGEEAVILSAKTHKKAGRLFGPKTEQVVVTAAVDAPEPSESEISVTQASPVREPAPPAEAAGIRTLSNRLEPITRTGREKLRAKFVQLSSEPRTTVETEDPLQGLHRRMLREGISNELGAELIEKISVLITGGGAGQSELQSMLAQIISAKGMTAQAGRAPRTVMLIGPCGVGKTTTAAKLAAEAALQGHRAALISIDQQRVAGADELERYARILGISMMRAGTPRELTAALKKLEGSDLVVIDTPGIGPDDTGLRDDLKLFLKHTAKVEVHLLVNAATTGKGMQKTIDCFSTLSPRYLIYTQMDWAVSYGEMLNTAARSGLAIAYLSKSASVSEGLQAATAARLACLLWPEKSRTEDGTAVTVIPKHRQAAADMLVANRNSDIFHRHACRALKRINDENMVTFVSADAALGQSYKPCRMCCADLYVPKPIYRPAMFRVGSR